jgi:hypothetical protein
MRRTLGILATALLVTAARAAIAAPDYRLGAYAGAELRPYTQARRTSVYVAMRDGVRLAVDVYVPGGEGRAAVPRPTILEYQRYGRAAPRQGGGVVFEDILTDTSGLAVPSSVADATAQSHFLRQGYVLVVADLRGAGASFGPSLEEGDPVEERDLKDLIDWIARQDFSNGRVGMYGVSYGAEVQPRATVHRPKGLGALVMVQGLFDEADGGYAMGGIFRNGWLGVWEEAVNALDNREQAQSEQITNIPPVDADPGRTLLAEAVREHQDGVPAMQFGPLVPSFRAEGFLRDRLPFIDSRQPKGQNNLYTLLPFHNRSGVPTLLIGGWNDMFPDDMLLWHENLTVPRRLIVGGWAHGGNWGPERDHDLNRDYRKVAVEALRWFDHWLKDAPEAGIVSMPPIQYAVLDSADRSDWQSTKQWPPSNSAALTLYLDPVRSDTARSVNDGTLAIQPAPRSEAVPYQPDSRTTTGSPNDGKSTGRWHRKPFAMRPSMVDNDWKAMTWTSPALEAGLCLVGAPVFHLHVSGEDLPVADLHAYLEIVDRLGRSQYLTEGLMRSSHRLLAKPPYRNFGHPFPAGTSAAVARTPPLGGTAVEMRFRGMSTSYRLEPGERLRLALTLSDAHNTATVAHSETARLSVHQGGPTPSRLELPLLQCPPKTARPDP